MMLDMGRGWCWSGWETHGLIPLIDLEHDGLASGNISFV
jgi:hypothetical protein